MIVNHHRNSISGQSAYYISDENGNYLHKDGIIRSGTGWSKCNYLYLWEAAGYWISEAAAQEFLDKWEKKMNTNKISQCKADIAALQKNLKKLEEEDITYPYGTTFTGNGTKLMLVRTGMGDELNLINIGETATGNPWCGQKPFIVSGNYASRKEIEKYLFCLDTDWIIKEPY